MPTYDYQCPEGHVFEKFQKMTDKPRAKCPVCGRTASRKISGGAGLVFKGSGFYITDYGKDGKGPRKAETEKSGAESKPDTAASSETKPADKSEPKADTKAAKSSSRKGKAASE
jgi:putative FmdB family regulatory protein